jgi:hypothetical protein
MITQRYLDHFKVNAKQVLLCQPDDYQLSLEERETISSSVQAFQLGEASEGRHLLSMARNYSEESQNPAYHQAIAYLIKEENRHSAYLGKFMRAQGIPLKKSCWTNKIFRGLRRFAGLELSLRTLVSAELIALTYYDCLGESSGSPLLKRICECMVEEEEMHVEFQMHHIHEINFQKFPLMMALADLGHAVILASTLCAVWLEHRKVLRKKFVFSTYFKKVWDDFATAMDRGRESAYQLLLSRLERGKHEYHLEAK